MTAVDEFNASSACPLCVSFDANTLVCGTADNLVHVFSLERHRARLMVLDKLRQEEVYSVKKEAYSKIMEAKASKKKKKSTSPTKKAK